MILENGRVVLARGPRHHRYRPAVDPLFRSAALNYGPRVVGVVLSGTLNDGTAGLVAIHRRGGITVVQDPQDASFSGMPASALANVPIDHSLPAKRLAPLITKLSAESVQDRPRSEDEAMELEMKHDRGELIDLDRIGKPSVFTCPDCHGTLWEIDDGGMLRYRCRIGHGYSGESMMANQDQSLEDSLWIAIQSLAESADLNRRLADRLEHHGQNVFSRQLRDRAKEKEQHAEKIRKLIAQSTLKVDEIPETPQMREALEDSERKHR
jgi:two-component system chemotaxis response regulator CheB